MNRRTAIRSFIAVSLAEMFIQRSTQAKDPDLYCVKPLDHCRPWENCCFGHVCTEGWVNKDFGYHCTPPQVDVCAHVQCPPGTVCQGNGECLSAEGCDQSKRQCCLRSVQRACRNLGGRTSDRPRARRCRRRGKARCRRLFTA